MENGVGTRNKRGTRETAYQTEKSLKRDGKLDIRMEENQDQTPVFITQCG